MSDAIRPGAARVTRMAARRPGRGSSRARPGSARPISSRRRSRRSGHVAAWSWPAGGTRVNGAVAYGPIAELLRAGARHARRDATGWRSSMSGSGSRSVGSSTCRIRPSRPAPADRAANAARMPACASRDPWQRADSPRRRAAARPASGSTTCISSTSPTREAVAYLARRLPGPARVLLVGWRREDLTPAGSRIADDLVRIPDATGSSLGRLDRPAVAEIDPRGPTRRPQRATA